MCKFSIIVPVYNVEKYIERCLDSLINQSYDDYEIIIVNDGSTDSSVDIIKKYLDNSKIKLINEENKGLSAARNNGVKNASGDYLIFVDSDDYIDKNLLLTLSKINGNYDLIKIQYQKVYDDRNEKVIDDIILNKEYKSRDYFMDNLKTCKPFEMAWIYIYKKSFYLENNFSFKEGLYHEDFGLIPLIILKSNNIYVTDFVGYYYNQEGTSIMRTPDYKKTLKKAYDMLDIFDYLYEEVNKLNLDNKIKKYFNSYISNGLIDKIESLNKNDKKNYINELKKRKVFDLIVDDTIIRKIKKILLKIKY